MQMTEAVRKGEVKEKEKKKKGGGQIEANNDKQKKDLASTEGSKSALH